MTTDELKARLARLAAEAPQAVKLPARSELDWKVNDATLQMQGAKMRGLALMWARRAIDAKFERGDFPVLQALDKITRESLAYAYMAEHGK